MNNDLTDLLKILSLYQSGSIAEENEKIILGRICQQTVDITRNEKYEYFVNNYNELSSKFADKLACIEKYCIHNMCDQCLINKWCNHFRSLQQQLEEQKNTPTYADFFCGAGGLSCGFHRAGFRLSLANDIQDCCIDTITLNHPEVPEKHMVAGDINDVIKNISQISRYSKVDVVIGGPPCQGFSMANRQRLIDDPRNHLYKSFIQAINILQPKFFVMENVRGMLGVKNQIVEDFNAIGYSATAHLLNAKDFGIPQNRERVIFIGNRLGINNEELFDNLFRISESKDKVTLSDAIADLPGLQAKRVPNQTEVEDNESGYTFALNPACHMNDYVSWVNDGKANCLIFNHKARYNNERDIEIFGRLNPGDNSADPKIADIMPYKRREKIFKDKYFKLEPDKICKTITAHMKYDCNMYIHPSQARGLTPREAARIQSYPDDYFFRGSYTKTYMQVGNSVPPLLSEAIAQVIKEKLKEVE